MNTKETEKPADYSTYAEPAPDDKLAQLSVLAEEQRRMENEIALDEERLAKKRETLALLSEKTLPELMDELGITDFRTRSGLRIQVAETIRANIPKARTVEAIKWLDEHGFQNLAKRKFTILFTKEDEAWARKFEADLRKRKHPLDVAREISVHARTLASFVKEQLEEGTDIPLDLFGVFRQRYSKVEVPK